MIVSATEVGIRNQKTQHFKGKSPQYLWVSIESKPNEEGNKYHGLAVIISLGEENRSLDKG